MEIKQVNDMLALEGFEPPNLNVLVPNENNYTVLIIQPQGHIEASVAGVRNRDRDLAQRQFGRFLIDAQQNQADLVIAPEYSMPWDTLIEAIKEGVVPAQGKLWVLGCESIQYGEIEKIKQDLAPFATVICETLQPDPRRFTDPLAYVFVAPSTDGNSTTRLIVLIQFKTYPMGDKDHFEINGLQRGSYIYQFDSAVQGLKLTSLICSDAFSFQDPQAKAIYDRALVIHLQMNPKPRQELFCQYRHRLLQFKGDETELICLNWARDVHEWCGESQKPWQNIAGSAWYLRPHDYDERDDTLCANHRRGLYYTWLKPLRAHALFFNYEPATYLIQATKVAHIGVSAAISHRRGPQLTKTCKWDEATSAWVEQVSAEDGFAAIVCESRNAKDDIKRIADDNPFWAERVLALCTGNVGHSDNWYSVRQLDSCIIDASEVIHRLTFCQDTDEKAYAFRIARLIRCGRLWDILKTNMNLPPALSDLKDGFRLEWSPDYPHQNAISENGSRATVIYMGEESSATQIEETSKKIAEYLRRAFTDVDQSLMAKQRLAVWFRENNRITLFEPNRYVKIDQTGDTSEFDIGREE